MILQAVNENYKCIFYERMRTMKKIRRSMLLFIMLLTFSMISVQAASSSKVIIEKTRASVVVGKSITLRAIAKGKSTKIIWSSSNRNIATVSSTGKVTGKKLEKLRLLQKQMENRRNVL